VIAGGRLPAAVAAVVRVQSVLDVSSDDAVSVAFTAAGATVTRCRLAEVAADDHRADLVVCIGAIAGEDVAEAEAAIRALAAVAPAVLFAAPLPGPGPDAAVRRWPAWWDDLFERAGFVAADVVRAATWDDEATPSVVREAGVLYVRSGIASLPVSTTDRTALHPLSLVRALDASARADDARSRAEEHAADLEMRLRGARAVTADLAMVVRGQQVQRAREAELHDAYAEGSVVRHLADRAEAEAQALTTARAAALERDTVHALPAGLVARARRPLPGVSRWATGALRRQPPLFDEEWYVSQHPEVLAGRLSPRWHYRRHGVAAGLSPHPIFDVAWYRHQVPGGLAANEDPVEHYLDAGADLGLDPHPLFATAWYQRTQYPVTAANPLADYLERWRDGCSPHPLFDAPWYLRVNPQVAAACAEPLRHFLSIGWLQGRDPRPAFDVRWYLFHSSDVAAAGENPLVHYVVHGWRQGRDPHRLFETRWYLHANPAVDEAGIEPLAHYLEHGAAAGTDPGGVFCTSWYVAQHPESAENPLEDYLEHGVRAGHVPSPWAGAFLAETRC
jgi:hypothetical protein